VKEIVRSSNDTLIEMEESFHVDVEPLFLMVFTQFLALVTEAV
jgi:hypothetical protein